MAVYILIFVFGVFSLSLLFYLLSQLQTEQRKGQSAKIDNALGQKRKGALMFCPICYHQTAQGEKVHAKFFTLPDGRIRVEVYGCDRCLPKIRQCPRCKKKLDHRQFVNAILTKKKENGMGSRDKFHKEKRHKDKLHIEGCINCYKR